MVEPKKVAAPTDNNLQLTSYLINFTAIRVVVTAQLIALTPMQLIYLPDTFIWQHF